jgi:DNA polymerase elongation subunit (family B)
VKNEKYLELNEKHNKMAKPYAHLYSYMHKIEDEYKQCVVRMYCLSPNGSTSIVTMKDFKPYFYLEIPEDFNIQNGNKKHKLTEWLNLSREMKVCGCTGICLCTKDVIQLRELKDGNVFPGKPTWSWVYRKRLYFAHKEKNAEGFYANKKQLFIKVEFTSLKHLDLFKWMCRRPVKIEGYPPFKFKIHEGEQPLLKFFATTRLPSIGWVDVMVPPVEPEHKITMVEANIDEYVCAYTSVRPSNDDSVLIPKIMTFDIEAYSHVHTAMPNVWDVRDEAFQISIILSENQSVRKILLSLGRVDALPGIEILTFASEQKLIQGFFNCINIEKPNVVLGYNSFGFDLRYLLRRVSPFPDYLKKRNPDKKQEDEEKRSPVHNLYSKGMFPIFPFSSSSKLCREQHEVWSSNAFGKQDLTLLDIDGVIFIDLYLIIKRDFKLNSYKLDAVAEHFLGAHKDPLTPKGIFKCFEANTPKSMALVGKYCVQDAMLTYQLFEKLQIWLGQCEMARTTKIPVSWLSTKGQQIKIYSQVLHYGFDNDVIVESDVVSYEDVTYKGATVYAPEPGIYHNVMAFDFASLYPSIIISHNIDYTSLVKDECKLKKEVCNCVPRCQDLSIPDEDCHVFEWSEHEYCEHDPVHGVSTRKADKVYCGSYRYRFLKHQVTDKGIIPTIISDQLDARKKTRKELASIKAKLETDTLSVAETKLLELRADVLEERQKSYKVNANSMYGVLGARKGYLPLLPAAMCVTYVGRQSIKKASHFITVNFKGTILYGDTDSCFCVFPITDLKALHEMAQEISRATQAIFPAPMKLEYEGKIYKDFFILSKKRYCARSCDENGVMSSKMLKKGVQTQRRDSTKLLKLIFDECVLRIMNGDASEASFRNVVGYITDQIQTMFTRGFDDAYYIITKSLSKDDYKSKPPQVILKEKMERRGKQVPTGSRITYVITTKGGYKAQQAVKVEEEAFYKTYRDLLQLDFLYYLEHQLMNPLNEIVEKAFKKPNVITQLYENRVKYHKLVQLFKEESPQTKVHLTFEDMEPKKKLVRQIQTQLTK